MSSIHPTVREMVKEAVDALGGCTTNTAVRDWILRKYPVTNARTIQCHLVVCAVNHPSRIHFPVNKKPRASDGRYDFLFRSGRGQIERYDLARHGRWAIVQQEDGRLAVVQWDSDVDDGAVPQPPVIEPVDVSGGNVAAEGHTFAAEDHLRDYLASHLDDIEPGLQLFVDDDGNDGVEYQTHIGRIDLLTVGAQDGLVVIELKVSRGPDAVAGQILRYKNWVATHMARDGQPVRGIIIAQHISERLRYAIASDPAISAMEYEISLTLRPVEDVRMQP